MENQVNEAVLTLVSGADRDLVVTEVGRTLTDLGVGTQVTTRDDNAAYQTLTTDVENDQQMFNALAFLLFAGAVVAAFILIHRLAQQQRREIGVSMALGVSPRQIAARPLLVSAQIALLGVALGVGVGVLIGLGFQSLLVDLIPLPIWDTSFQAGLFATVAVVGFLIPFLATGIPVWRAVRVAPVEAIKPTHLSTREVEGKRRTHRHLNTFSLMPWRNLRRSRWRTGFTVLAIAFVLTVLVAFLGVLDSFNAALDTAASEDAGTTPDRLVAGLDSFYPTSADEVAAIGAASTVAAAEPSLRLGGTVSSDGAEFDVLIDLVDLESKIWTPTVVEGNIDGTPGLVLAEKAAADLGAGVGDTITLRHPVRTGPVAFSFTETAMPILAVHPHPIRTFAYMDVAHADVMGLPGIVNMVQVAPDSSASAASVQRELFDLDGVASVQSVAATTETVKDQMGAFIGLIQMMAFIILFMALLIAFLTASISLDARAREHATMAAFGVKTRTMMRMAMTESFIIGVAATLLGVAGGIAAVWWMTSELFSSTLPEFGMTVVLTPGTVVLTMILGIGAVAIAPLFTVRRLRRMDVPGTLRLVE
jgi:putative ABC transport system permease protein